MPRVHTVLKNRKPQKCGRCQKEIAVGEGYKHWSFRYGGKSVRCLTCKIARSELTQSSYYAQVYDAQDGFHDALGEMDRSNWEEYRDALVGALENAQSTADDVRSDYEAALDAWENGNEMLQEKYDAAEAWYEAIENVVSEIQSEEPDFPDEPDEDADEDEKEKYDEEKSSAIDSFVEDITSRAESAVDDCELC